MRLINLKKVKYLINIKEYCKNLLYLFKYKKNNFIIKINYFILKFFIP